MVLYAIRFKYSLNKIVFGENTMSARTLVQTENPTTQRTDAVEALAAFLHKSIERGVLDLGSLKLVKSNKGDVFYGVTKTKSSCPSAAYRPGQSCKHQRKFFPQVAKPVATEPKSIRPTGKWAGGYNGSVTEIMGAA
jgi:hypothetical protein